MKVKKKNGGKNPSSTLYLIIFKMREEQRFENSYFLAKKFLAPVPFYDLTFGKGRPEQCIKLSKGT